MSLKESIQKLIQNRSTRAGLMLVLVAALTIEASSLMQLYFSRRTLANSASKQAEVQLQAMRNSIMDVVNQTEIVLQNNTWLTRWCLDYRDSLYRVSARIVQDNPGIIGSAVALVPGVDCDSPFCPYVCETEDSLSYLSLATEEYNYPSKEWYTKPLELNSGYWSEPYIDVGGGEVMMTTFSLPVQNTAGITAAVLTAEISIEWLGKLVEENKAYPNASGMILSRTGRFLFNASPELIMKQTVHELAGRMRDSVHFRKLNKAMLGGESGKMSVNFKGQRSYVYYAPVERTGWSMCFIVPYSDIFSDVRHTDFLVHLLQLLGFVMLLLILNSLIKSQVKFKEANETKERLEGDLRIASSIQMSMVPTVFPSRKDLDMSASIVPAREVGGDLYDFYIRDEKLYFCVGDVSGKGVPAALVMAVTRSAFRTVSAHEDSAERIVTTMNNGLTDTNDSDMFVTFFCGVLDLTNGHLNYCNAGHNPPVILTDSIQPLPVEPNLPLGIVTGVNFKGQEIDLAYDDALFLYTDGVTEAENEDQEQFGEERMKDALHGRKGSMEHLNNIQKEVAAFVGSAPQSDDLTMLFIHYLGNSHENRITIDNDVKQISRLEGFVNGIASRHGLSATDASAINLALEEAVTNVVLYAYPKGQRGRIDLDSKYVDGHLEFALSDSGVEFDPTKAPDINVDASVEERPIGGLGIHLVRTIMDSVRYERKGGKNILRMTKII